MYQIFLEISNISRWIILPYIASAVQKSCKRDFLEFSFRKDFKY